MVHVESGRAFDPTTASWRTILTLAFQTLGIIYSDIGTSPLYTLNGLWPATGPVPPKEDVIGGLSAIVWALTLLPLIKYVFICLRRFGTGEGEGGTFALFQGLFPPEEEAVDSESVYETSISDQKAAKACRSTISQKAKWPLFFWCIFGTSLTLADGVFTPAVSVTSAIAGIGVAKPSINSDVIPISIAFLLIFFFVQFRGTSQLGFTFAPITAVWFALIAATGIVNICSYPGVFRAFDPSRAVLLFVRTRDYDILAGVLLALTGCEAMFASMGHFTPLSIQISFSLVVYPSVILAYLGQGARLIVDGDAVISNLFYATIPGSTNGPLYWIIFVFAILATFIACQTLITASFSLVQQLMSFHVVPPLRIVNTSETIKGQVYIPAVNWLLMIITILVVGVFKNPVNLTNAYGFSVATVMFSTTVLIAIQMRYVKHLPFVVPIAFLFTFGFFDALFWGAALKKIPEGAWVPLMIGVICMLLMTFWSWAKGLEDKLDVDQRQDIQTLISSNVDGPDVSPEKESPNHLYVTHHDPEQISVSDQDEQIVESGSIGVSQQLEAVKYYIRSAQAEQGLIPPEKGGYPEESIELIRLPTCAVFHRLNSKNGVPPSFIRFIQKWPALPHLVIFLSVRPRSIARVPAEDRYVVHKIRTIEGFYGVTYFLGFRDTFDANVQGIVERIATIEARLNPSGSVGTIRDIRSVAQRSTHVVPHYLVQSRKIGNSRLLYPVNWMRSVLIEEVYRRLALLFPDTVNWFGPKFEVVQVGVNATI